MILSIVLALLPLQSPIKLDLPIASIDPFPVLTRRLPDYYGSRAIPLLVGEGGGYVFDGAERFDFGGSIGFEHEQLITFATRNPKGIHVLTTSQNKQSRLPGKVLNTWENRTIPLASPDANTLIVYAAAGREGGRPNLVDGIVELHLKSRGPNPNPSHEFPRDPTGSHVVRDIKRRGEGWSLLVSHRLGPRPSSIRLESYYFDASTLVRSTRLTDSAHARLDGKILPAKILPTLVTGEGGTEQSPLIAVDPISQRAFYRGLRGWAEMQIKTGTIRKDLDGGVHLGRYIRADFYSSPAKNVLVRLDRKTASWHAAGNAMIRALSANARWIIAEHDGKFTRIKLKAAGS